MYISITVIFIMFVSNTYWGISGQNAMLYIPGGSVKERKKTSNRRWEYEVMSSGYGNVTRKNSFSLS